eukprot:296329-Pleurochrysis_carterae.AAC.1
MSRGAGTPLHGPVVALGRNPHIGRVGGLELAPLLRAEVVPRVDAVVVLDVGEPVSGGACSCAVPRRVVRP